MKRSRNSEPLIPANNGINVIPREEVLELSLGDDRWESWDYENGRHELV